MNVQQGMRALSLGLAGITAAGALLLGAAPAAAGDRYRHDRGRERTGEKVARIATYALGAGTAYAAARGNTGVAVLGGVGTYVAYRKWKDEVNDRHDREYYGGYYGDRYRDGRYRDGRYRDDYRHDRDRWDRDRDRRDRDRYDYRRR